MTRLLIFQKQSKANVDMEDHDDDDDAEEELEFLPRLQVFVRPQEEKPTGSQEREKRVYALKRERKHHNSQKKLVTSGEFKKNMKMIVST